MQRAGPSDAEMLARVRRGVSALEALMADLDEQDFALVVLPCTGHFDGVRARTLMVESQRLVDHAVDALGEDGRAVGVMVPLRKQMDEFHVRATPGRQCVADVSGKPVLLARRLVADAVAQLL